jgi:hypothetical protein
VATSYNNLGQLFIESKKMDLALRNLQMALKIAKIVWGLDHPNTQTTLQSIYYVLKNITHAVVTSEDTKAMEMINNIKPELSEKDQEMLDYFEFLMSMVKQEEIEQLYQNLTPEYKKLFVEVQQTIHRNNFEEKLKQHSILAIKTHLKEKDHIQTLQSHISNLGEDIHPEITKYYDFLLNHAQGIIAEEIKHTIDKPFWDFFQQIKENVIG